MSKMKFISKRKIFYRFLSVIFVFAIINSSFNNFFEAISVKDEESNFSVSLKWNGVEQNPEEYIYSSSKSESRMVRLKVSYENKKVTGGYNPGEIIIVIPGLKNAVRSEINPQAAISADLSSSKNKIYDWSYTYNSASNTYTFTNNVKVDSSSTFQGSFEIIWQIESRDSKDNYSQELQAVLRTAKNEHFESNIVKYSQVFTEDEFTLTEKASALYPYQIPLYNINPGEYNNYIWVKYTIDTKQYENSLDIKNGTRKYKLWFLQGAVVNSAKKTNELKTIDEKIYECYETNNISEITVAYKRSEFEDTNTVKNYVEIYGVYNEQTEEKLLAETSGEYALSEFELLEWMYGTEPYYVNKTMYGEHSSYIDSKDTNCKLNGAIKSTSLDGSKYNYKIDMNFSMICKGNSSFYYDVELLDEEMQIQTINGSYRRLLDDEYNFNSVIIPSYSCVENKNKISTEIVKDKYSVELYLRHSGSTDFDNEAYKSVKLISNSQTINLPEDTVGIKIVFRGIDENFINANVIAYYTFHTDADDIMTDNGQCINFLRNRVYQKNGDSYNLYGYFDRTASLHIHEVPNMFSVKNDISISDEDSEYYYFAGSITANTDLSEGNELSKFSLYTIVPEGLQLQKLYNNPDILLDKLSFSGKGLNSSDIKDHTTIELIENYKSSGRTYIALHFDFFDNPIVTNEIKVSNIPMYISKDTLCNISYNWIMRAAMLIDQKGKWYASSKDNNTIEEGLWADIDRDTDTSETASFSKDDISLLIPEYSHLELTKLVKTNLSGDYTIPDKDDSESYIEDTIPKTYANGEYSYKIRVGIGEGSAKNIIMCDTLEDGPQKVWQGGFVRVDYSYAEELYGVKPNIYYSTQKVEFRSGDEYIKPDLSSNIWTTEKPGNVRSVAVDFGDFELEEGRVLYIEIIMKAPNEWYEYEDKITENSSFVFYDNYSAGGFYMSEESLPSNYVPVRLVAFMGNIRIVKEDAQNGTKLSNVKFDIYRMNGNTPDKSTDTLIKSGLVTDSSGLIRIDNIKYGKYYAIETIPKKGYELLSDPVIFELNDDKPNKTITVNVKNERKDGQFTLQKTSDRNSSAKLSGAKFAVYTSDGILVQENLTTDNNGTLVVKGLEWGNYYIVETEAPKGYIKSDKKYEFTISAENDAGRDLNQTVVNQQLPASATLTKYEILEDGRTETKVTLDGAVYELYDSGDNLVGTYITDKNGKIYAEDLAFGSYYFVETVAAQGYEKYPNRINFTVDNNHINVALEVRTTDTRLTGKVWLQKVDDKGQYVKGAKYGLFRKSDNVQVDETGKQSSKVFTTNDEAIIEIEGLYWGEYYLKEIEAPKGYELNEKTYDITINRQTVNKRIIIEAIDPRAKGSVEITKVDENDRSKTLAGAVFTLYKSDGSVYRDNIKTGTDGKILVKDIEWGSYYFLEKTAPAGYGLNPNKIRFSVNYLTAKRTQYLTVTDPQIECELTVTKSIAVNEIVFAHGNPTFVFKVDGNGVNGKHYTFYQTITFTEDFLTQSSDRNNLTQSVTFSGLPAGTWAVSEVESIRYTDTKWENIQGNLITGTDIPTYSLNANNRTAHIKFINNKAVQSSTSHTSQEINILKCRKKVTAIIAVWNGPSSISTSTLDRTKLDVYAIYDDGSKDKLADNTYTLSPDSFEEGVSAEYTVTVTYFEDGRAFTDSFNLYANVPVPVTTQLLTSTSFTENGTHYDGTVAVTGYTGKSKVLRIPESVSGLRTLTDVGDNQSTGTITYEDNGKTYKVTQIISLSNNPYRYQSIYGIGNIEELIIPDSVISIGTYAFSWCRGLKGDLVIPGSVKSIGNYAFIGCSGFTGDLIIPNGVTSIGDSAFDSCSGFTGDLIIPNGVTSIGDFAFDSCSGFTGDLIIPDSVKSIGTYAFRNCSGFTGRLKISNGITSIGSSTFDGCSGFTGDLIIPNGVTSIGTYAFDNCSGFTGDLIIPNGVTSIGYATFDGCSGFTGKLIIPNSVTSIGDYAFCDCSGFTGDLIIPNSVKSIGDYAFCDCSGFTGKLIISNGVTSIKYKAFSNCSGFTGELVIPNSLTSIERNAFYYCTGLSVLKVPNSVTTIGNNAFKNVQKVIYNGTATGSPWGAKQVSKS